MTELEYGRQAMAKIIRDVDTGDASANERWESFTPAFIAAIATARVYVDCGAEYGFYIRLALRYGPPGIRIFAFEPDMVRAKLLRESLWDCANVTLVPCAVADRQSVQQVAKPAAGVSLSFAGMLHHGVTGEVLAVTIDEVLDGKKVDVLKMDVEGAEDLAFAGMRKLLDRCPDIALFVEFHPTQDERTADERGALLQEMRARQFEISDEAAVVYGGRVMLARRLPCAA